MTCPCCGNEWAAYQETKDGLEFLRIADHHYRVCTVTEEGVTQSWKHTKKQVEEEKV